MSPEEKLKLIQQLYDSQEQLSDRVTVSTNVTDNLTGALIDIKRQGNVVDAVSLKTLERIEAQLAAIGAVLEMPDYLC